MMKKRAHARLCVRPPSVYAPRCCLNCLAAQIATCPPSFSSMAWKGYALSLFLCSLRSPTGEARGKQAAQTAALPQPGLLLRQDVHSSFICPQKKERKKENEKESEKEKK
mmetsp:Transcript_554/g.1231  ORF Transcript_554/g.1231 Transcript_554/m.1231 type:complete len:110 (+) Transcript_554:631-960(+)